ncbi:hypothetical protein DRP53_07650 [candidate division WOR-3 bacterium]|uniref:PNPLA domain-containing protein n=1 Tax=candidate division WOR-3 bacterium TaxID=2052148 RepID=A0A660SFL5_UNCW3|nr:MAG: hypothetical protein DRP53_07650 [candidate division WOR-3 bacterium]
MRTLILGGGGARGYAHIGFVKLLEEEGIIPDLIVGTSFGALVGGFYCAGFSGQKIGAIASRITLFDKLILFLPSPSKTGIAGGNIYRFLSHYLGEKRIEDGQINFAAVAVDLERWEEVVITNGRLVDAIYASITIPVIIVPRRFNGRLLIDGGMIAPLPIRAARRVGAERIVAVNVLPRKGRKGKGSLPGIFLQAFDIMTMVLIEHQLEDLGGGLLIDIDPGIRMDQFERAEAAITAGYRAAKKALDQIKRVFKI